MRVLSDRGWSRLSAVAVVLVPVLVILLIAGLAIDRGVRLREFEDNALDEAEAQQPTTFPLPPLDLVVPTAPRLRYSSTTSAAPSTGATALGRGRQAVSAGADTGDSA